MSYPNTEFDSPWKEALEAYFPDFIAFFLPDADREINWNQNFEFLDKELQQVARDASLGKRLVDKLVKVYRHGGEETWVLIHIEIQTQSESDFTERMYVYNYRIYDRYRRSVASLAVLGDESSAWRPSQFTYELFGSIISFQFPVVKLLDYQQRWSELEESDNPFATLIMAHLKALETIQDHQSRKEWKLALTKRLYFKGYARKDIINLFRFIDWMMTLPAELQEQFQQLLNQYEEEKRMPYITSVERSGIEKGMIQKAREYVIEVLEVRFEEVPTEVVEVINQIKDTNLLKTLHREAITTNSLNEWTNFLNQSTETQT